MTIHHTSTDSAPSGTIAIWETHTPVEAEVAAIIQQVLMTNAMLALCESIAHAYVLMPDAVIDAYRDPQHRKFDALLWREYLTGLIDAISAAGPDSLPRPVAQAYARALEARNYMGAAS